MMIVIRMCILMLAHVTGETVFAAADSDLTIGTTKAGVTVTVDRNLTEGRVLTSVTDTARQPVSGLGIESFTVSQVSKTGRVNSSTLSIKEGV